MSEGNHLPAWILILLAGALTFSLNLSPYPWQVVEALQAVQDSSRLSSNRGESLETVTHLRFVLTQQPWRQDLWGEIADRELASGRLEQALEAYRLAVQVGDIRAAGMLELARAELRQQNDGAALALVQTLVEHGVAVNSAYSLWVQILRDRGDPESMLLVLRQWQSQEPLNPELLYLLGLCRLLSDPQDALDVLLMLEKVQPTAAGRVLTLRQAIHTADLYNDLGFQRVVIGRALGSIGEWDMAALAFQRATIARPDYPEAWAFWALAQMQLGQDGQKALNQAAALDAQSTLTRAVQALRWRRAGDLERALTDLEALAAADPRQPVWQVEIAGVLAEKGELELALGHYHRAAQIQPDSPYYWRTLARYCAAYEIDVREIGLPAVRQALLLSPDDPENLELAGWVFMLLEDYDSAERFLQQALQKETHNAPAHLRLAQVRLGQNRFDDARLHLLEALRLDGAGATGKTALRLLERFFPGLKVD